MRDALVDNATLTAVQRLLGQIPVKNLYTIDGDIMAFENLIQAILFNNNILFLDDYKPAFRSDRRSFFSHFSEVSIDKRSQDILIDTTKKQAQNVVPQISNGTFSDSNFKPFFELLKMHNIFTWDMSSSVFYLTQKLLCDSGSKEIEKYSMINAMLFSEGSDKSFIENCEEKKTIIYDSKGNEIRSNYRITGIQTDAHIGKQAEYLFANLNWLAFRTIYYTLAANELGVNLFLHPIRHAFQVNYLTHSNPKNAFIAQQLINTMSSSASETLKTIYKPTTPYVMKYPVPIFCAYLANKTGSPSKIIEAAFELRNERAFQQARTQLDQLDSLFSSDKKGSYLKEANKFILDITKLMEQICTRYSVSSSQGVSLSPMIYAYNLASMFLPQLPTIPAFNVKVHWFDGLRDYCPQKGFNAVYKSVVNDLTCISQLGKYHEMLTADICRDEDAVKYPIKTEEIKYMHAKSDWKIPL